MICSIKQSPWFPCLRPRQPAAAVPPISVSLPLKPSKPLLSVQPNCFPLSFNSPPHRFPSAPLHAKQLVVEEYEFEDDYTDFDQRKLVNFECMWAVLFIGLSYGTASLVNKLGLFVFPYPWLLSAAYAAAGSLWMLACWILRVNKPPKTDLNFWLSLFPVAVLNCIGHVATMVSLSNGGIAMSFTHIIRCLQPVFVTLLSRLFLGAESVPMTLLLSLIPMVGGSALAAVNDPNRNMAGFIAAMVANLAYASRNVLSERWERMRKEEGRVATGVNYFACLSMVSFLILAPLAFAVEGPQMWAVGMKDASTHLGTVAKYLWKYEADKVDISRGFLTWIILNQVALHGLHSGSVYQFFPSRDPFVYCTVNCMKKIFAIIISVIFLRTGVPPMSAVGAAIAILGIFIYSREICKISSDGSRIKSWFL